MNQTDGTNWPVSIQDHTQLLTPLFQAVLHELATNPSSRSDNARTQFSNCMSALGSKLLLAHAQMVTPQSDLEKNKMKKTELLHKIHQQQLVMNETRTKIKTLKTLLHRQYQRSTACVSSRAHGGQVQSTLGGVLTTQSNRSSEHCPSTSPQTFPLDEDDGSSHRISILSNNSSSDISGSSSSNNDDDVDDIMTFDGASGLQESHERTTQDHLLLPSVALFPDINEHRLPTPGQTVLPSGSTSLGHKQRSVGSFAGLHAESSDMLSNFLDIDDDSGSSDDDEDS